MAGGKDDFYRYTHLPRKVFDKYIDRMALKRQRDREDHRNDLANVLRQIRQLENQLTLIEEHVKSHCHVLQGDHEDEDDDQLTSTEEL